MRPGDVACPQCGSTAMCPCVEFDPEQSTGKTMSSYHGRRVDAAIHELMVPIFERLRELERTVAEHDAKIGGPRVHSHIDRAELHEAMDSKAGELAIRYSLARGRHCPACGATTGEPCHRIETTPQGIKRGEIVDWFHYERERVTTTAVTGDISQLRGRERLDAMTNRDPILKELADTKKLLGEVQKGLMQACDWIAGHASTCSSFDRELPDLVDAWKELVSA